MAFRVTAKLFLQLTYIHTPPYAQHTGLLAILNLLITNSLPSQSLCMWCSLELESNLYLLQQK